MTLNTGQENQKLQNRQAGNELAWNSTNHIDREMKDKCWRGMGESWSHVGYRLVPIKLSMF